MKPLGMFWGKVVTGAKRGRLLGYPTANIPLHKDLPDGIYAATVTIDKQTFLSATFIGVAEMFGEKKKKAENFILHFSKNIYGAYMTVRLYKKIRSNQRFSSEKALIDQIEKDVKDIELFFKTNDGN